MTGAGAAAQRHEAIGAPQQAAGAAHAEKATAGRHSGCQRGLYIQHRWQWAGTALTQLQGQQCCWAAAAAGRRCQQGSTAAAALPQQQRGAARRQPLHQ